MLFDDDLKETEKLLQKALQRITDLRRQVGRKTNDTFQRLDTSLNIIEAIIKEAEDSVSHTDPMALIFYPDEGTVFIDTKAGKYARPLIVENKKTFFPTQSNHDNVVIFYDREEGVGEYPDWIADLFSGRIKVIWCPQLGTVISNDDYIAKSGLRKT